MFYSVAVGRATGIYVHWPQCHEAVVDYPGASYRKWETIDEATAHLNKHGIGHDKIVVHLTDSTTKLSEFCMQNSLCVPAEAEYEHQTLFDLHWGLVVEVKNGVNIYQRDWNTGERLDRGVTLSSERWANLLSFAPQVTSGFERLKREEPINMFECLGSDVYLSMENPYRVMHIRRWFKTKTGQMQPTKEGITLR